MNGIIIGNIQDYKKFIHKVLVNNLTIFDKTVYVLTKWNSLLYRAAYDLYLKKIIKTKTRDIPVKGKTIKSLLYVQVYHKIYYYDNQAEVRKFKKWVKENG